MARRSVGVAVFVVAFLIAAFFALRARQGDDAMSQQRRDEPFTVLRPLDSFDRPDDAQGLGAVPGGPQWEAAVGTWGIAASQAYVVAPAPGRNIAVVELGQEEGAVQVRVPKVAAGAGIVFRYRDPSNYWAVFAVPAYATWNIVKVVDGKSHAVANTGVSSLQDGVAVAVRTRADTIDVIVGTQVTKTITDATLREATKVGLTVEGDASGQARFDDVRAALPASQPAPAGP
jgi:hypothetical protein